MKIEIVYFSYYREFTVGEIGSDYLLGTSRYLHIAIMYAFDYGAEEVWIRGKVITGE